MRSLREDLQKLSAQGLRDDCLELLDAVEAGDQALVRYRLERLEDTLSSHSLKAVAGLVPWHDLALMSQCREVALEATVKGKGEKKP